ncbi:membrane protein [Desulfosporosinus sp. Tol-M]|nr:membrane protein [Desulfosporosinus sp. Tol-M]
MKTNYHRRANITLAAVFLFFLSAAVLEYFNPGNFGIRLMFFVSEAALVGGIADWFAVTAIFKKPLGWGYHTALIPRNREKVIEAVASIVQTELLNMTLIRKKIEGIPFIEGLLLSVEKAGGSIYLTDKALVYLRRYAEKQEPAQLAEKLATFIRCTAKTWNLAPRVQGISGWALKHGYIDLGMDCLAEGLWDKAADEETRQTILRYLEEIKEEKVSNGGAIFRTLMGFVEMSDGLNLDEAADALQAELLLTLRKFRDPLDSLRIRLKDMLLNRVAELEFDTRFCTQVEQWKEDILNDGIFSRFLEFVLGEALKVASSPSTPSEPNALYRTIHPYVEKYWVSVQHNPELRARINAFLADTLCRVIQNEHDLIGGMVRETLAAHTDQDLNRFVEEKAGNDLQWIRINGSMIGGVVGLLMFLFLDFVYEPIIIPVIMNYIR